MSFGFKEYNYSQADGEGRSNPDFFLLVSHDQSRFYLFPISHEMIVAFAAEGIPRGFSICANERQMDGRGNQLMTKAEVQALLKGFTVTRAAHVANSALQAQGFHPDYYFVHDENYLKHFMDRQWMNHIKLAIASAQANRNQRAGAVGIFARLWKKVA